MFSEKKNLDRFIELRNKLIVNLEEGILDKREFILRNYELIQILNMKPYLILTNIEKCIYNYQYYNILAKYHHIQSDIPTSTKRNKKKQDLFKCKAINYYNEKDKVIKSSLSLLKKDEVIAYPLIMKSTRLNNKLYEIVLLKYDKAILHTMNTDIKDLLIKKGCFDESPKVSIIDQYVNKGY